MLTLGHLMILCVMVGAVCANVDTARSAYLQTQVEMGVPMESLFHQYKITYSKKYKTQHEEQKRKLIFQDNLDYIRRHNDRYNKNQTSYRLGLNDFSDLVSVILPRNFTYPGSHREFLDLYTNRVPLRQHPAVQSNLTYKSSKARSILPMTVDWRGQGYDSPVRAQGLCGACWAFIAAESIAGQLWRRTKQLVTLSAQQLVDCVKENNGCTSGYVDLAYAYVMNIGGMEKETDYPYKEKQSECMFDRNKIVPGSSVRSFKYILPGDEESMKEALVNVGPLAASIDASHRSFQMYENGVYDEPLCSTDNLDHGGLVIGYGDHPEPYWLVKNSWGLSWGEAGYIRMARNKNNQCGIASEALFPVLG